MQREISTVCTKLAIIYQFMNPDRTVPSESLAARWDRNPTFPKSRVSCITSSQNNNAIDIDARSRYL